MLNSNTKKYFVLIVLFVFPVFIYLFFASGKNNFALLPILSEDINEISSWDSLSGDSIKFEDNISILGFWGSDVINKKTEALYLNQKIYKRFFEFNDFQFVIVLSKGQEIEAESLKKKLKEGVGTNLIKKLGIPKNNITMIDSKGVIHTERKDLNKWKSSFAIKTNKRTL